MKKSSSFLITLEVRKSEGLVPEPPEGSHYITQLKGEGKVSM